MLFCTSCGIDLGLETTPHDAEPAAIASSSELLRSLLGLAARRQVPHAGPATPPGGTAVYGGETVRMLVDASAPGVLAWGIDTGSAPEQTPSNSPAQSQSQSPPRSLAEAEAVLCARVQGDPAASKRVMDLLCLVAAADGEVDDDEASALARTMGVLLGGALHDAVVKLLIGGSLDELGAQGFDAKVAEVASSLRTYGAVEEGLMLAIAMAYASGGFSGPERAVVLRLARAMDVRDDRLAVILAAVRREVDPG